MDDEHNFPDKKQISKLLGIPIHLLGKDALTRGALREIQAMRNHDDDYDDEDWENDELDEDEEYDDEDDYDGDEVVIVKQPESALLSSTEQECLRKDLEKKCKRPVVILPPGVSVDFVKLGKD